MLIKNTKNNLAPYVILLFAVVTGAFVVVMPFYSISMLLLTVLFLLAFSNLRASFLVMIAILPLSYVLPTLHLGLIDIRIGYMFNLFIFLSLFARMTIIKNCAPVKTPLDIPIFIFILINFISISVSPDAIWSTKESIQYLYYGILYFSIVNLVQDSQFLKKVINIFLGISFLVALIGLAQFFLGFQFPKIDIYMSLLGGGSRIETSYPGLEYSTTDILYRRVNAIFFHHNGLANFLLAGLMISISLFQGQGKTRIRWVYAIIAMTAGVTIVLTYSRGAWVGAAVAFFCFTLLRKKSLRFNTVFLTLFLVLFLLSPTLKARFGEISDLSEGSTIGHFYLLKVGMNIVKQHPILGIGSGAFQIVADKYIAMTPGRSDMFIGWGSEIKRVLLHNAFIQIWAETGTVGLLAFLWILFRYALNTLSAIKRLDDDYWQALLMGIFVSVIAILVQNFTITFLIEYFWALLALTIVIIKITPAKT